MNVLEMLSSTLAHGSDLNAIARSTLRAGSHHDVEWCMVGLTPYQEHLLRARYQLDAQARRAAWARLFTLCMGKGWQNSCAIGSVWTLTQHSINHWLGWSADEHGLKTISPHICKSCEGVGGVMWESKALVCKACGGSGRKEIGPHTIMRVLDIAGRVQQFWVDRHNEILRDLDGEESAAVAHMVSRLRD